MPSLSQVKPVLCLLLFLSGSVQASTLAKSVLEASPVDDIVATYPDMMSEGVRQGLSQSGRLDPMMVSTIVTVVRGAFQSANIENKLVADLSASLSEEQLNSVGQWYRTPLAERISRAEIKASSTDAWLSIQQGAPELQAEYRGSERAQLFTRYDKAARATESAVDTTVAVQLGLATAMAAFQGGKGPGFDQMEQMIESQRDQVRAMVAQQVYDIYLYTYQDLSNDELNEYIRFLESDAGTRFTRVVTAGIQDAITRPVKSVGRQLARFLNPS
ncbi:DUF2059 domain-containing protein [Marinobacter sp. CHS3-4]|uniref:DUF2059 domain-containing protein n=1 Tax=Marinobacter sp. CHS3-4 TaxID=3045174 RepID=UPI0024B55B48|nr:DUF2059 domain-containing protein [Marinobacter sp. CHS3-4]MDI9244771.1 DUF2059 domain-containing protein [Marinobacter sp. CHS3-4]